MNREELDKYKIREYYMIPVEIVDNIFYEFETQLKKQKEAIDKAIKYIKSYKTDYSPYELSDYNIRQILDILKEVS